MKFPWMLFYIFIFVGCSLYRIDSNDTSNRYYPSKSSAQEVLYLEQVTEPFEVIGSVSIDVERFRSQEEVIEQIKHEAAMIGGDAILDIREAVPETKSKLLKNAYLRKRYLAKVIVFKPNPK